MKKSSGGVFRFIYPVVLFAAGVMAWMYFRAPAPNYYTASVEFDNRLVDVFNAHGVSDRAIVVQTRREHADGNNSWIEYYREIAIAERKDRISLVAEIRRIAENKGYEVRTDTSAAVSDIAVRKGEAVFSRTVFSVPRAAEKIKPAAAVGSAGRIALVIDDVGGKKDLSAYLDLAIPVTFAVMPRERYSRDIARMLDSRQMPFILHLPLEPLAYPAVDPGKAALLVSMTPEKLRGKFLEDLKDVPGARGVSNHMGSRFTSDRGRMSILLSMIREKGLFFFDSYTSSGTVAGSVAGKMRVPHATNSFFLDIKDDPAFMERQWQVAMRHAKKYGTCIVIGHIQKENMIPVLRKIVPEAKKRGYSFVYLTELVR